MKIYLAFSRKGYHLRSRSVGPCNLLRICKKENNARHIVDKAVASLRKFLVSDSEEYGVAEYELGMPMRTSKVIYLTRRESRENDVIFDVANGIDKVLWEPRRRKKIAS